MGAKKGNGRAAHTYSGWTRNPGSSLTRQSWMGKDPEDQTWATANFPYSSRAYSTDAGAFTKSSRAASR